MSSSNEPIVSEDVVDRCPVARSLEDGNEDMKHLLKEEDEEEVGGVVTKRKSGSVSRPGSTSSPTYPSGLSHDMKRQTSTTRTISTDSMSNVKRDSASSSHHSYHFRRKLANFRSDSVFSDVIPATSSSSSSQHDPRKDSDSSEKAAGGGGGSLSSLKTPKESKWIALRKKLKINSSPTKISKDKEHPTAPASAPLKHCAPKRSLFQRAKTLAILPVAKSKTESDETRPERHRHRKNQHLVQQPKELFNVGGEMNMIPLEFLIDINDLNLDSK